MEPADPLAGLRKALAAVEGAHQLMQAPRPDHLDASCSLLQDACRELGSARTEFIRDRAGPELLEAARQLRGTVTRTARLLEYAFDFHHGWLALKGSLAGGYDRAGKAADFQTPSRLSLRG